MNYLAHVYLSHESPEAILGAILGDFVKGRLDAQYRPAVRAAIELHRALDRHTDAHPLTRASCALVSRARRRFAPVLVDVFYDHFLARHWVDYCPIPLPQFAQHVYHVLAAHQDDLPTRLQVVAPRMAAYDWLTAYATLAGIDAALNGIARRLGRFPRAAVLCTAVEELEHHYLDFERYFREYFPQLIAYTQSITTNKQAA